MECKECKITCEGKEVATINCTKGDILIKCAEDGKNFCKGLFGKLSRGCC